MTDMQNDAGTAERPAAPTTLVTGGYKLLPLGLLLLAFALNDSLPGTLGYRRLIDVGLILLATIGWNIVDVRHQRQGTVTTWTAWTSFRSVPVWMWGILLVWLAVGMLLAEFASDRLLETLVWSVGLGVALIATGIVDEHTARRRARH